MTVVATGLLSISSEPKTGFSTIYSIKLRVAWIVIIAFVGVTKFFEKQAEVEVYKDGKNWTGRDCARSRF